MTGYCLISPFPEFKPAPAHWSRGLIDLSIIRLSCLDDIVLSYYARKKDASKILLYPHHLRHDASAGGSAGKYLRKLAGAKMDAADGVHRYRGHQADFF